MGWIYHTSQGRSVAEVARRLGVTEGRQRAWRKVAADHGDALPGHGSPAPADEGVRRVRAEVARPSADRDLIKKAAAYSAGPPT